MKNQTTRFNSISNTTAMNTRFTTLHSSMENKEKVFEVLSVAERTSGFENAVKTFHLEHERDYRHNFIMQYIGGFGDCIGSFVVNRNHPKGLEIHHIFSKGIVLVQNKTTKVLVTEFVVGEMKLKRYWEKLGIRYPKGFSQVALTASEHARLRWNTI